MERTKNIEQPNSPTNISEVILGDFILSNNPFAQEYRHHKAKYLFPNTELGIDLKHYTSTPGPLTVGQTTIGFLTRDSDDHFTFIQADIWQFIDFNAWKKKPKEKE